ncbi:Uncharacterised protein [Oligella ureolytica]|uniref:Transposase n=1 Tax=Oligella ureolytica TaxID=90244 RepID=A0A378XEB0_9BURK|nr:transposase [Oligella ureolytica]SUA51317.1 Uncharacterised protein [Oligella ureolytica]
MPMTAHCYLDLLGELAITASHSRPRVSNDNAMSESQFKTLKYQPDYPRRFDSFDHAMRWCEDYYTGTTTNITTAAWQALRRIRCLPVSTKTWSRRGRQLWTPCTAAARSGLPGDALSPRCRLQRCALTRYLKMPTRPPSKMESTFRP